MNKEATHVATSRACCGTLSFTLILGTRSKHPCHDGWLAGGIPYKMHCCMWLLRRLGSSEGGAFADLHRMIYGMETLLASVAAPAAAAPGSAPEDAEERTWAAALPQAPAPLMPSSSSSGGGAVRQLLGTASGLPAASRAPHLADDDELGPHGAAAAGAGAHGHSRQAAAGAGQAQAIITGSARAAFSGRGASRSSDGWDELVPGAGAAPGAVS